jgi:pantothenate kinase
MIPSIVRHVYENDVNLELSMRVVVHWVHRYMVAIAGSPGAGKSTVAKEVAVRLNALWLERQGEQSGGGSVGASPTEIAVAVPMDGFHLYRWQLDAMEVSPPWSSFLNLMSLLLRMIW